MIAVVGYDIYTAPNIVNTHSVNFFYEYNQETSMISLSKVDSIDCKIDGYQILMTNKNLKLLVNQFESKSKEMMIKYGLVDSYNKANSIMERIERGNNPDEFKEFKNYIQGHGNGIKSYFEIFLHPLSIVTAIPSFISKEVVGKIVEDEKHIKNINKFSEFVASGTLAYKQGIYRYHLKDFLLTFAALKEVYNTGRCCSFRYDSCGISHIKPI